MVSTDPIADMLTRIRNAIAVHKNAVSMPYSKIKLNVANVLMEQNFIDEVTTEDVAGYKRIVIKINETGTNPRISHIKKVSKPGRRTYSKVEDIPRILGGRGVLVVSTSKGLMTDNQARKNRIGGELICEVY